ncbi:hypothetical protein LSG31_08410 [Fodinisporobacter ferrooxydans]|uniref:Uncharacterized protein n=1 Tax=Fodinisporobacter ferrooxydans TaxID=2901836 RepID=A0ABY4CSG0_9BACL|nr:hypothetical protein LSG31_08410 [Alicyclobacillaceae bacterium MYW30-H2]
MSDHHHHHEHNNHEHNERLLKYYQFTESSNVLSPIPAAETQIAQIHLKKIRSNDRVQLKATIEWNIKPTAATFTFTTATFSIWRDHIGVINGGTLVCQYSDTNSATAVGTFPITTTFVCTDTNVPNGAHNYFLTVFAVGNAPSNAIVQLHFDGSVIDENE